MRGFLLLWCFVAFCRVSSGQNASACECNSYTGLNAADRMANFSGGDAKCDSQMKKAWYRFTGAAGSEMPTTCVPVKRCGTHAPGWMDGKHPSTAEGIVSRQVCFHWSSNCCRWSRQIRVQNCGEFYVYELGPPPVCNLRYCGSTAQGPIEPTAQPPPVPAPECKSYSAMSDADRKTTFSQTDVAKCDRSISQKWYRFTGAAGSEMPTTCVPVKRCGTHAPGWMDGKHPSTAEGIVSRQVCFHWSSNCCRWSRQIRVRNCGEFYVYELGPAPVCNLRYCGSTAQGPIEPTPQPSPVPAPECKSYSAMSDADRKTTFSETDVVKCDRSISQKWYRFTGAAGSEMPTTCVPVKRCGTHAPGWMDGKHPSTAEGIVSRQVCFHWSSNCCRWSRQIRVRNCGEFYVYELGPAPVCNLRYCGSTGDVVPTSTPSPTPSGSECAVYAKLSNADRAVDQADGPYICDNKLVSTWYRFVDDAGDSMPEICPEPRRCGAHAPGWLKGGHPLAADGAVQREVCFHWNGNCCRWRTNIRVRNCGEFFVYELAPPPACNLRYCATTGASEANPTPPER